MLSIKFTCLNWGQRNLKESTEVKSRRISCDNGTNGAGKKY
jgi:hypothetical protein